MLDGLDFSMIYDEDVVWLERSFDEDEVVGVVFGFNGFNIFEKSLLRAVCYF